MGFARSRLFSGEFDLDDLLSHIYVCCFCAHSGMLIFKKTPRWFNRLTKGFRMSIRTLRLSFKQPFKLQWLVFVDYLLKKLPIEASLYLHTLKYRDISKFQDVGITYEKLNRGRNLFFQRGTGGTDWVYPWEGETYELGMSRADLVSLGDMPVLTPDDTPNGTESPHGTAKRSIGQPLQAEPEQRCKHCQHKMS